MEHGKWIDCSNGWMCSSCGEDSIKEYPYCPHCGAKMDLKEKAGAIPIEWLYNEAKKYNEAGMNFCTRYEGDNAKACYEAARDIVNLIRRWEKENG